jgi:tetratricopeptide (TPR) repeat protein
MPDTLNFFDQLLSRARRYQQAGQWRAAMVLLRQLGGFRQLPGARKVEILTRLGEILLKHRRYRPAQKRLLAAVRHDPDNARLHFLLAQAEHGNPQGDKEQADRHYRRSLELAPLQVRCRSWAGLLAIETGRTEEGLALLRQAVEDARQDPGRRSGAVTLLVKGLCLAGQPDEALAVARTAFFQTPRCARLRQLWIDRQLASVRREQEIAFIQDSAEEAPVLLPFVPRGYTDPLTLPGLRKDAASVRPGPHLMRLRPRAARRRAP